MIRHVPTDGIYVLGTTCKSRVNSGEWVEGIQYQHRGHHGPWSPTYVRPLDQFHNFVEVIDDAR